MLSLGNYNKVAVANFNTVIVKKDNVVYNSEISAVNTAVNGFTALYGGNTAYGDVLNEAAESIVKAKGRKGAEQVVILISDGIPANSSGNSKDMILQTSDQYTGVTAAQTLLGNGTFDKLLTVVVGTDQGTYLSSTGQPAALHANLKASRDKLAALDADCGTAKTYNNVRKYFGMTQLPEITGDPEKTLSTVEGKQVTLAVEAVAADNGTLTYQWYKDGAKIDGAASASYSFTAAAELDGAKYHVVVTGVGGGTATSAICELTVICADEPDITTDLAAAKVMPLQAFAELEVAVKTPVYGTLSYQWYKNGVKIDGATKASYGIADVKESDAGSYQVKITNTYETSVRTAESTVCTVTVAENPNIPVITAQPKDVTVGAKDKSFTLSAAAAAAEGGTLSYQWYKDGVKIDGATSAAYTETDPDPEKDAGRYTVRVTNTVAGEGSFTSTSKEAKVSFDEYYDVLVLVDTSVSMRYDCEDPAHSYFSASALTSSGLDAENIYKHYVVSTDADGNIKVDASAICNPAESCGDRLHDATAAARKIAEDVLSIGNYNKVAVANFNSAVVNKNFVYNDNMTSVNTAVNGLAAIYGGITSYTNALNQAAARMTTAGVTRSGAKQVVILISDGVPAASSGNSIDIVVKDHENYTGVAAAKTLLENGTIDKLMTLSVGSEEGTYLSGTGAEAPVPAALKARTDFLKRLDADCDSAETYNNVRAYFGIPVAPEKPVITKDVTGQQIVIAGSEVTMTVGAETADKGTLSYQWYKNGAAISGATAASYTFTATQTDDKAKYSVKVSNTLNGESASVNSGEFELLVRESAPLDVVILMDTSKSMAFDCGNDAHSYLSNSVMEANGITGKLYNHYVVNKAADGTISIDASAIQNPAEDCGDRLHQAQAAARDMVDAIYAQDADNRVAVCGFNSVVVPLGSADAKLSFKSDAASAKADLAKLRVPYAGATNYTNVINGTDSVRGIKQMLAETGVLRTGAQPVVIIISDGVVSSNDTGTSMAGNAAYNGIAAAEALKAAGIDVLTVGVGETKEAMKVYQADGTLSAKLTNLLANHETLKELGVFDTADTWNNVRSYLGMPAYPKKPEITKDLPEGIVAVIGEKVTAEVAATAETGEVTYQWYINDTVINGATGASYTFTVTEEMNGAKIKVEAINSLNGSKASVFSRELALTVTTEQVYDIVLLVDTSKSMSYDCENEAHSYQTQKQYDLLKPDYAFNNYRHGLLKKLNGYTVTDADPAKGYYIDASCSNRLQDAQAAAEEIADMIWQNSPDSRVAVTGFNTVLLDQAFDFNCASADDVDAALAALVNHALAYKGATNYTDVLNQVSDRLAKEGVGRIGTKKIVIMISDGCPSQNDVGNDKSADTAYNGIAASEALVKAGVDVYTVGVGSSDMIFYQPDGKLSTMSTLNSNDEMLEKLGKFSAAEYLNNIRELFGLPQKNRVDANKYDGIPEGEVNVLFLVDTSKSMQYDCHNPYHSYQTRSMYDKLDPSYPFNQYRHGKLTVEAGNYVVKTDPENLWYIKDECYNRLHEAEEIAEEIAAQILADNPKANFAVTGFNTQLTDSRLRFDLDSTAEVNEELRGLLYGEKAYAGTTNYTEVLKQVRAKLQETHPDVPTVVIMISDGTASDNEVGKNLNRSEKYNGLREAQELKQDGFKLYTLAVGNLSKSMYFYTPSGINTVDMKALRASDAVLKEMGNYSIGYDWNKLIYAEGEEPGDGGYSKRGSGTYIDAFAAEGGSITDEGRTAMGRGKSKTYQVTADEGWSVYKVVAMPAYVDPGTQQEILDVDADGKFTVTADTSYVIRAYFTKNGLVKGQMDDYDLQNVYDTVTLPEGPLDVIFMMDTSKSMWHDCQNAQHSYMTRKQYDIQSLNRWYPFSNYAHGQVTSYKNSTVVDADAFFGYYVDEYCQTRLQDSVLIAKQLVKKVLDSNEDNRVAIAGFRDVLTSDQYGFNKKLTAETAEEALDAMLNPYNADTYAGPTNYSAPLEAMKKGLLKKTRKDATTVIVMLTDGIPSTNDAGNNSASDRERNGMDQINALKEQGVKVITISVGQLTEAMQFYQPEGNRSTMTALCTSDMLLRMLGDEYYEGEKLLHPEEEILPVTKPAAPSAPEKEPAKDAVEIVDEPLETKDFPWWIVIVCAAVVIAAAVLIVIVCRKNKGNKKGNNF